ncbi:hypothetical protein AHAS_Ahas02G0151100 [Arachis hypogaea]
MEEGLKQFFFFVVTKGHFPGVYTSWEEANKQQECVCCHRKNLHVVNSLAQSVNEPPGITRICGLKAHDVVQLSRDWLVNVCHDAQILGPYLFKQERFTREKGPFYRFTVVVPSDPFEVELSTKSRFSLVEEATREDASFEILSHVLDLIGKEI